MTGLQWAEQIKSGRSRKRRVRNWISRNAEFVWLVAIVLCIGAGIALCCSGCARLSADPTTHGDDAPAQSGAANVAAHQQISLPAFAPPTSQPTTQPAGEQPQVAQQSGYGNVSIIAGGAIGTTALLATWLGIQARARRQEVAAAAKQQAELQAAMNAMMSELVALVENLMNDSDRITWAITNKSFESLLQLMRWSHDRDMARINGNATERSPDVSAPIL